MPEVKDYGWALRKLKAGAYVRRKAWKNVLSVHLSKDWMVPNRNFISARIQPEYAGEPHLTPIFLAIGADYGVSAWAPSTPDQLAEDWEETNLDI
jgi:hypothetical protein